MDTTTTDDILVGRAVAGDQAAFAAIYDRYADCVHTMCAHMLADRDEAADVCGDVFLAATERLGQLKDPSRLKPWLFAIARRLVYTRTRHRHRDVLVSEVDDMASMTSSDHVEASVKASELAGLVREAADGLDQSDRLVLELTLQGLAGSDLAASLGVSDTNAYQASHRMKERLERSLGALLVARQGREDCARLDELLRGWDGRFSVRWRKRVARHVDGCETCGEHRSKVPSLLLGSMAGAVPLLAAPASVRDRVLSGFDAKATPPRPWSRDGFPPRDGLAHHRAFLAAAGALVVLAVTFAVLVVMDGAAGDPPRVSLPSATKETTSTTAVLTTVPVTTIPPSTSTTVRLATSTTAPPTTAAPRVSDRPTSPPTTTTSTTTSTTSTTTTTVASPTITSFSAHTATVSGGSCSTGKFATALFWSSSGATRASLSGPETNLSGLSPSGSTVVCRTSPGSGSWTLTVSGPGGSDTASA
jgi:RNA polymerase sigma factor (sigma-70 family)